MIFWGAKRKVILELGKNIEANQQVMQINKTVKFMP